MNAIQQKCRPKHQVLVLKCYPRTTKGAVDVKPNSSELSYLLFYALSRRSKIAKIGSFLEKKTANDVWRLRIGNVQVTLQILTALMEKSAKDVALIAPCVLKVLDLILNSNDITLVESSIPTFDAFCQHHDTPALFADQTYLRQYEAVVGAYAAFASTTPTPGPKGVLPSKPVALRWRNVGLGAIEKVAASDALSSVTNSQLQIMVPMVLENLWSTNEDFVEVLLQRLNHGNEKGGHHGSSNNNNNNNNSNPITTTTTTTSNSADKPARRRASIATVRTVETSGDTNPIALSGTAMDVDKLAEEDIGVLALRCLKQIFIAPNRSQIHTATAALLTFVENKIKNGERVLVADHNGGRDSGWAIRIFEAASRWAPVQDRYVILVTAMETLSRSPLDDGTLHQDLISTAMIGSLLRSDVNLIGLSIMDVLLALVQRMKKLIQLPVRPQTRGDEKDIATMMTTTTADGNVGGAASASGNPEIATAGATAATSRQRRELLSRLQQCIGDLATHVYYADQISDMIQAILSKLRPNRGSIVGAAANSIYHADRSDPLLSPEQSQQLDPLSPQSLVSPGGGVNSSDLCYFSQSLGKVSALKAIKAILLVANPKTKLAGSLELSRNRVPISVWENTQGLLRDSDGLVRKAYADALLTWLDRETTKADSTAKDERLSGRNRASLRPNREGQPTLNSSRRAASTTSNRERPPVKGPRSHFLTLLHLAIYENALQYVEFESDFVLLHILLTKLVMKLGVNATRYGLPMIYRLQEDIQEADAPIHKVRIGSLCHGYFWALSEKFEFDTSVVGRAIHTEIVRRRKKQFWVEGINVPPPFLELAGTPGLVRPQPKMQLHEIESEALLPFDDRPVMVDCIVSGYQESSRSPPASPGASPSRTMSVPMLGSSFGAAATGNGFLLDGHNNHHHHHNHRADGDDSTSLPATCKEQMMAEWTRDSALAMIRAASKSESLNGSRTGTTGTHRGRLGVNGAIPNGQTVENGHANGNSNAIGLYPASSPYASQVNLRPSSMKNVATNRPGTSNNNGNHIHLAKMRRSSLRSGASPSPSDSSRVGRGGTSTGGGGVASVDQLKLILSGLATPAVLAGIPGIVTEGHGKDSDSGSDSMVSYESGPSEVYSSQAPPPAQPAAQPSLPPLSRPRSQDSSVHPSTPRRSMSRERRESNSPGPLSSHPTTEPLSPRRVSVDEGSRMSRDPGPVPPVPPLPSSLDQLQRRASELSAAAKATAGTAIPPKTPPASASRRRDVSSSRGGAIEGYDSAFGEAKGSFSAMDLQDLLRGISSQPSEGNLGVMSKPPY